MASNSPSNNPLPTAWLPPPQQLLTTNYKVTVEPAPITISAVFASLVLIVIIVIAQRKAKGSHLDEIMKDDESEDLPATSTPGNHDGPNHGTLGLPRLLHSAVSRDTSLQSDQPHYNRAVHQPDPHTSYSQTFAEQERGSVSRWSAPRHHRERDSYDDTTLADDEDKAVYSNFEGMRSNEYIASEAQSVVFSEFVPLDPSVVGMHDKVWK